jgi:hypothetical protein
MRAIVDYSSAEPDAITGERLFTTEAQRHREKHKGKQTAGASTDPAPGKCASGKKAVNSQVVHGLG